METSNLGGVGNRLDIRLVISEALQTMRRLFGVLLLVSLIVFLLRTAVSHFIYPDDYPAPHFWLLVLLSIPMGMVISGLFEALAIGAIKLDKEADSRVSLMTVLSIVRARLVPLILASLLPNLVLGLMTGLVTASNCRIGAGNAEFRVL